MKELELKYGCNPNQKNAKLSLQNGQELPIEILGGRPGFINLLDAFNSWQLVRELREALNLPAAASFKHVSPSGAAVGVKLSAAQKKAAAVDDIEGLDDSLLACAYARARGTDRLCSFGDFIALSDDCDLTTAKIIAREVSDGIIAPNYSEEALEILRSKREGKYIIIKMDTEYKPPMAETKEVFGISFTQDRNDSKIDESLLENIVTAGNNQLPAEAKRDLVVAMIALKYTQSNSVCYAYDGQTIGVGAGQQSRIHCNRLAGGKADNWLLRHHERVLNLPFKDDLKRPVIDNCIDAYINGNEEDVCAEGVWQKYFKTLPKPFTKEEQREYLDSLNVAVSLGSDAFFPFSDNIERAKRSNVKYIAQPGGSIRDDVVIEACNNYGITMAFTGLRLFHH